MDEVWQRHKAFILQCVIGGIVLLIALGVKSSMYSDIEGTQLANMRRKGELETRLKGGEAPNPSSIREQQQLADAGEKANADLAREVASVASPRADQIDYVRENVRWALANLGRESDTDRFVTRFGGGPQGTLFDLREDARGLLVSRAATLGRTIDETLGLGAGVQSDEVPIALHGLAMVIEVVSRALSVEIVDPVGSENKVDVIDSIDQIRISVRGRRGRAEDTDPNGVRVFIVSMTLRGGPDAIAALLRGFNRRDGHVNRRIVLDAFEGFERERQDQDRVRVKISLLGLHHLAVAGQDDETGDQ